MALSDAHGRGMVQDLSLFHGWCLQTAGRIAGRDVTSLEEQFSAQDLPRPLTMALNAVFTGLNLKKTNGD